MLRYENPGNIASLPQIDTLQKTKRNAGNWTGTFKNHGYLWKCVVVVFLHDHGLDAMTFRIGKDLNVDIDDFINPYLPPSQLHRLPTWISWWLGYRSSSVKDVGNVLIWWWSFFGAFCGILTVAAVYQSPHFETFHPPVVFASLVCIVRDKAESFWLTKVGCQCRLGIQHGPISSCATTKLHSWPYFGGYRWCWDCETVYAGSEL